MATKLKITIISIVCILMIGCAGTRKDFVPLSETAKQRIASSKFILIKNQEELNAEVNASNIAGATGGGLIFALVDVAVTNSRANATEKLLAPIRNELIDFDVHKEIKQSVVPVVQATPWLKATADMAIVSGNYQDIINKTLEDKSIKADVVGAVSSDYTLDSNFNTLKMTSVLELYSLNTSLNAANFGEKKSKKPKQPQPIYRTKVVYNKKIDAATKDATKNAKLWAVNNGQAIKLALKDAVSNTALQLKEKLLNPHLDQNDKT